MADIETLIEGSEKLTDIFGYWPSFHDAEVIELHFWRGDVTNAAHYIFPVLTLKIHLWELTQEVNPEGFLVLRNHMLATLRFHDVLEGFKMDGFNHQNAIFGINLAVQKRMEGTSALFDVELVPAFGIDATFQCIRIEVVDVVRCSADGTPV